MNSLTRILASLGAAALIAAGIYVLLLVSGAVGPRELDGELLAPIAEGVASETDASLGTDVGAAFSLVASGLAADEGADLWAAVGIAALLIAAGILLLAGMTRYAIDRDGRATATVLMREDENGSVRISIESIKQLAERTGNGARSVRDTRCSVKVTPGGLMLDCLLKLKMAANIPEVTAEVQVAVRDVIERLTGLRVIDVSVRARYAREREKTVRVE